MKKNLFTMSLLAWVLCLLLPARVMAETEVVNGIWYEFDTSAETATVVQSQGTKYEGAIDIPSDVEYGSSPYTVTSIGWWAFAGCSGLTSITIPESVTRIENNAFSSCSSLTSITIPASVTGIGGWAFNNCSGLTSITVESGNSVYDSRENCNAIIKSSTNELIVGCKNTVIPSSVTSIGEDAFWGCSGLTSVTIPESVTSIGNYAFEGCTGLTSIAIPASVTSIGYSAFDGCSSLTSVTVKNPTPVTITDSYTFSNRANATLYVPAGSKAAYEGADYWKEFKAIVEMEPEIRYKFDESAKTASVVGVLQSSTYECNIVIPSTVENSGITYSVTSIGVSAFEYCRGVTSITIPASVTSIGSSAFSYCSGLTSVTIPASVTSIGNSAFYNCSSLTSITISESVTSIGEKAFAGCTSLSTVTSFMVAPQIMGSNIFPEHLKTSGTLYVPANTRSIYVEKGWSLYFANIIEMDEGEPIWLSIIDQEQGRTDMRCKAGQTYTFRFNAPEGRRIQSVTFRGADVTDWLTEDGEFTTPAMSKSAELIVTYDPSSAPAKGDLNGDGKITIADVTALVNVILGKGSANPATIYDVERVKE